MADSSTVSSQLHYGLTSPVDVHAAGTDLHMWVNACLLLGTPKDVTSSLQTPVKVSDRNLSR